VRVVLALVGRLRRWARSGSAAATSRASLEARRKAESDRDLYL
jgi:hypothetical protein